MEEKQLDFNAPLLSVRRLSTTWSNLDGLSCNSNSKLRPTRQQTWEPEQPAAIPFTWEQIPGKSKDRKKPNISPRFFSGPISIEPQLSEIGHGEDDIDMESSSRSFSSDIQTRDYLMNRFLPAAKSMIVETPRYVAKKQDAAVLEPPRYVSSKVYSGELLLQKYPINSYNHEKDKEIGVVEEKKKSNKKGFGFLIPRFCTKRSSCNPDQMPTKIRESRSSFAESAGPVPRLSRRTSYSGPLTPSLDKQAMDAVIKKRAESRSKEMHGTRSGDSLPSSPHRGLSRSGRISPYRNESPRSPFHDGARFLGVPKDVQNQAVQPKTCASLNVKSHFSSPVVPEKTLYIDWIEKSTKPTPNDAMIESDGDAIDSPVRVPPLPKSPSESWLWRKMTLRSPFPKKLQQQAPIGPNWETIVKTSNVHHHHVRYSEELLNVSKYTEISF